MQPETYFLRYAFPCARVLVDIRKRITEEEYKKLEHAVQTDEAISRETLEQIFPKAIQGLKKIRKDYWTIETIKEYFWNRHEEAISTDLPPMIQRLCQVKKGALVQQIGNAFKANLGNNDVRYVYALYPNAKAGDNAMIHYGYAVEKI